MLPIDSPKHLIKEIMAFFLYRIGILSPRNSGNYPIILYYHRVCDSDKEFLPVPELSVSKNNFEKQMEFIKEEFNVFPLDVLVEQIRNGKRLPCRDIAITFDDGYMDNYTNAYPILKKYGLPATIFITTGYIGGNHFFWWDKLTLVLKAIRNKEIDLQTFPSLLFTDELKKLLINTAIRRTSLTPITNYLKSIGTKKREEVLDHLEKNMANRTTLLPPKLFLSWEEIKEMSKDGITFGSHSHSHPVLTEINDENIVKELNLSKELIRENIGREVKAFSYPDGCVDNRVKRHVIEAGYHYAVQTKRYAKKDSIDIYAIPRKMVKEAHSKGFFNEFSKALFTMELSGRLEHLLFRNYRRRNPYERLHSCKQHK